MTTPFGRRLGVGSLALGVAALLAIASPLSADAHVSLEENTAAPGTFTTLTFRVPNETDTASTDKLTVTLPHGTSLLASVSYLPVPGWTAELVTGKLAKPITSGDDTITEAVTQVIWTADDGAGYGPGSLGIFKLFVGPIPDVGHLTLPVEQGYSDGSVVSWGGGADSEHPAPVLYIDDAPVVDHDADSAPVATVGTSENAAAAQPDPVGRLLGGAGLLLGAVALVVAIVGRSSTSGRPKKVS